MKVSNNGELQAETTVDVNHLRHVMAERRTKAGRKRVRTEARLDKELTPTKADALSKGYQRIMAVLSRGCSVSVA